MVSRRARSWDRRPRRWPRSEQEARWERAFAWGAIGASALPIGASVSYAFAPVNQFAAGALLAMLADTLLPEAYAVEGPVTGLLVVAGFALSLALAAI